MRTDPSRDREFIREKQWGADQFNIVLFEAAENPDADGPSFRSAPFSGGERNRLFLQRDGNYDEMTLVSGVDFRQDGRGFALSDFDRDGFMDLIIASPNEPRLRIARNQIRERQSSANGFVELRLVGGQTTTEPSTRWSARDPFGATVLAISGETKRMFQLSCGEGISSQNTNVIHIGMGGTQKIDSLEVTWPSGKTSRQENMAAGERITIFENPNDQSK